MEKFNIAANKNLFFGLNSTCHIVPLIQEARVRRLAIVTGARSFRDTESCESLLIRLKEARIPSRLFSVGNEPTCSQVDEIVETCRVEKVDGVLAVGGGSVIDTGKAVSAMIPLQGSVVDYLEGIGSKAPRGEKVFFVAVPTTSGTGSEATKNAVISGDLGTPFKKSLRHDNYVPDAAVVDPVLTIGCPPHITAASGLDAVTQLIESYVSSKSCSYTDALSFAGLQAAGRGLERAFDQGSDLEARENMAFASYTGGVALANAGLGVVHGLAGTIGGIYPQAGHGELCGTLLGASTRCILATIQADDSTNARRALAKYGAVGWALSQPDSPCGPVEQGCSRLLELVDRWTEKMALPRLGELGIPEESLKELAAASGNKNTPVDLTEADRLEILKARL